MKKAMIGAIVFLLLTGALSWGQCLSTGTNTSLGYTTNSTSFTLKTDAVANCWVILNSYHVKLVQTGATAIEITAALQTMDAFGTCSGTTIWKEFLSVSATKGEKDDVTVTGLTYPTTSADTGYCLIVSSATGANVSGSLSYTLSSSQ